MKKKIVLFLLVIAIVSTSAFASDKFYKKGDTMFSFTAGPSVPAFIYKWGDSTFKAGFDTNLKLGGIGGINFDGFFSEDLSAGLEIGYNFNYVIDDNIFTNVPIALVLKYYPIQNGKIDIPLSVGAGINFGMLNGDTLISLFTEAKLGFTYFINNNWGFGFDAGLYMMPHFNYVASKQDSNGLFAYAPITLRVSYRK